jgi:acyl dehydratase
MKMTSRFAGTPIKALEQDLSWRQSMNFAAAVGDDNPRYFDDERAEGLLAPPMLAAAITWPSVARIAELIEAPEFPIEALATLVHASEHLQFHRPIRPGARLRVAGAIAAVGPHRAGTLIVIRFEARDADGSPVFTEHMGGLLRGVTCADSGAGLEDLPAPPSFDAPGQALWDVPIAVDRLRPFLYDGCTGIVFPIHTSRKFARAVGLPDIILQGTATLALAAREIVDREAAGDPTRLQALGCRFGAMVFPGTEIRVRLLGRTDTGAGTNLDFEVLDHRGQPAVRRGYARIGRSRA